MQFYSKFPYIKYNNKNLMENKINKFFHSLLFYYYSRYNPLKNKQEETIALFIQGSLITFYVQTHKQRAN